MPIIDNLRETPRHALHIFYVLDTSGSMAGESIATLNRAMRETTEALKDVAETNPDAELKIAVMSFDSDIRWINNSGPVALEDFIWQDLTAGGLTEVGAAMEELNSKLRDDAFMKSLTGAYMPIIIFMSDGYATDDYKKKLDIVRQNKMFRRATKIGFAIGDADLKMIAEVVGNSEAVIQTTDLATFAKLMKFVSVTSSVLRSQSSTNSSGTTGADIVGGAQKSGLIDPPADIPPIPDYDPEEPVADWEDPDWA